jgi:pyruvate/2-oxoglutarate dehydrogenase complex dihydrolipoamide acyltransferase (E2) component
MTAVVLPDANWEGVDPGTEALLERWLVAEGSRVRAGQPIARVVLVKATLEVTAPADGVLARIAIQAEQTFGRGAVLAELRAA